MSKPHKTHTERMLENLAAQEPMTAEELSELFKPVDNQIDKSVLPDLLRSVNNWQKAAKYYQIELRKENDVLNERGYKFNNLIKAQSDVIDMLEKKQKARKETGALKVVIDFEDAQLAVEKDLLTDLQKKNANTSRYIEARWKWGSVLKPLYTMLCQLRGEELSTNQKGFFIETATKLVFRVTGEDKDCRGVWLEWNKQIKLPSAPKARAEPVLTPEELAREARIKLYLRKRSMRRQLKSSTPVIEETAPLLPTQPADRSDSGSPSSWQRQFQSPKRVERVDLRVFELLPTGDAK